LCSRHDDGYADWEPASAVGPSGRLRWRKEDVEQIEEPVIAIDAAASVCPAYDDRTDLLRLCSLRDYGRRHGDKRDCANNAAHAAPPGRQHMLLREWLSIQGLPNITPPLALRRITLGHRSRAGRSRNPAWGSGGCDL
jgi:hypothetical protein